MSQESVERFLGRILTDESFRRMVRGSMKLAMASSNFTFTKDESAALESMDWNLFDLAACQLDSSIRRSSSASATPSANETLEAGSIMAKAG